MRRFAQFRAVFQAMALVGAVMTHAPVKAQDALTTEDYVRRSAVLDMVTVQASHLAAQKAQSADVRAFAEKLAAEHQQSDLDIRRAVDAANLEVSVPNALDPQSLAALDSLRKATPPEFDRLYMDGQIRNLREVLRLHMQYAKTGEIGSLKQLAETAAPHSEKRLTQAEKLQKLGR